MTSSFKCLEVTDKQLGVPTEKDGIYGFIKGETLNVSGEDVLEQMEILLCSKDPTEILLSNNHSAIKVDMNSRLGNIHRLYLDLESSHPYVTYNFGQLGLEDGVQESKQKITIKNFLSQFEQLAVVKYEKKKIVDYFWTAFLIYPMMEKQVLYLTNLDIPEKSQVSPLRNIIETKTNLLNMVSTQIPGINRSFFYVGGFMSPFLWHKEDQNMMSASLLISGGPKIWFVLPKNASHSGEDILAKYPFRNLLLPQNFLEFSDVYYFIQKPGEIIFTFPGAYHCGFSCGPSFSEAINFVTPSCLLDISSADLELQKSYDSKIVISSIDLIDKFFQKRSILKEVISRNNYGIIQTAATQAIELISTMKGARLEQTEGFAPQFFPRICYKCGTENRIAAYHCGTCEIYFCYIHRFQFDFCPLCATLLKCFFLQNCQTVWENNFKTNIMPNIH